MSPRPPRAEQHPNLAEAIKETAWQQIAEDGAPALSLRAVARALGITAPAIYNYFPRRDDLVTALIVDAFTSFGDAQAEAIAAIPETEYARRLLALSLAYRRWAVSYPERYRLIFGTPIAGYAAPTEVTTPATARSLASLLSVLASAHAAGRLKVERTTAMPPEVESMFRAWQAARALDIDVGVLFLALTIWSRVHGLVSLEVGNQFPPFIGNAEALYRHETERLVRQVLESGL